MSSVLTPEIIYEYPRLRNVLGSLAQSAKRSLEEAVSEALLRELSEAKKMAVAENDQRQAKAAWCLESILITHLKYEEAFGMMRNSLFYSAWCKLEQCEKAIQILERHFYDQSDLLGVEFIRAAAARFQALYPYALFFSPELWKKAAECSICGASVRLRGGCGHEIHEIYNGERCYHIITKVEVLAISIVNNPVQKYSVAYLADPATGGGDPEKAAYPSVSYAVHGLQSPWDQWELTRTTERHPHERYSDVKPTEECPCIAPKGTYAECCLPTSGVLRPHFLIEFHSPPPPDYLTKIYL
jgi:hypothetical protein